MVSKRKSLCFDDKISLIRAIEKFFWLKWMETSFLIYYIHTFYSVLLHRFPLFEDPKIIISYILLSIRYWEKTIGLGNCFLYYNTVLFSDDCESDTPLESADRIRQRIVTRMDNIHPMPDRRVTIPNVQRRIFPDVTSRKRLSDEQLANILGKKKFVIKFFLLIYNIKHLAEISIHTPEIGL